MNEDLMTRHPDQANAKGGTEMMQDRIYRYVPRELLEKFQIWFSRYDESMVDNSKIQLLYVHDLPGDPMYSKTLSEEGRKKFAKILFVSNWQQQKFMDFYGLKWSECGVIRNAIEMFDEYKPRPTDKVKIIYHTTPHRGLEILAPVFRELSTWYPVELDVYSSFKVYGWPQRDEQYKELFASLRGMSGVNYHGAAPNETVREALQQAHIFAYPSIWTETSCIALMEAMSAGCFCIHPNLGALPETSAGATLMYGMDEDMNRHANLFYSVLDRTVKLILQRPDNVVMMGNDIRGVAQMNFDINTRVHEWVGHLSALAQQNGAK